MEIKKVTPQSNKTKMALIGALVVVVIGVGAFQFTQGSSSSAKKSSAVKDEKSAEPTEPIAEATLTAEALPGAELTARDPFKPIPLPREDGPTTRNTIIKPPPTMVAPPRVGYSGPSLPNAGGLKPMPPDANSVTSGTALRAPDEFTFVLVGIVSGPRPVAVFQDSAGSQKLVRQGEAVDEGSRVISVTDGQVVVRHGKKNLTLTVGGRKL